MRNKPWFRWLLIAVAVVAVAVVVGPFVYINFIKDDAPPPLALDEQPDEPETTDPPSTTPSDTGTSETTVPLAASVELDGTWTVSEGSEAGYRAEEILFGQGSEAAGRTTQVTGEMVIAGTVVSDASFEVDMASIESSESRRDDQFRGRIMDVATYPTSTFVLTAPIELDPLPAVGEERTIPASGDLTLRGTTMPVTFDLQARRNADNIEIAGNTEIVFDEWNIPEPSGGPAQVGDVGTLEFHLFFAR